MWWYLAAFVVGLALAVSKFPKQQSQPPADLSQVTAPTAEEGREIPVLFGTKELRGPNFTWWGHFKTVAIRKKGGKK